MRTRIRHPRRGGMLLGLAGLAAFLGALCFIVLDRAADSYLATSRMAWRLELQAAAEGAQAAFAAGHWDGAAPIVVGRVEVLRPGEGRLRASLRAPNGRTLDTAAFAIACDSPEGAAPCAVIPTPSR
ncbi:MAG: hypothetical protein SF028_03785 [Candidatus Sumerlaeia bacterium]|nr:hypothetical protein [Candidatus Sumerlaeia bacterium]